MLALCLMLSAASAEVTMTEIKARSVELNTAADTLLVQNEDRTYHVESLSGEALSADFPYAKIRDGMFLVSIKDEYSGSTGVLNGQGQEVVPPEYFNAEIISDRWVAAQTWKPSTAENYDVTVTTLLSDEGKKYYLVDTVDLYYCGEKKGTLTRMEYNDAQAFGDYLRVRNREGEYTFYNTEMEKSPVFLRVAGIIAISPKSTLILVCDGNSDTGILASVNMFIIDVFPVLPWPNRPIQVFGLFNLLSCSTSLS